MADLMQRLEQHAAAYSLLGEKDLPALLREAAASLRAAPEVEALSESDKEIALAQAVDLAQYVEKNAKGGMREAAKRFLSLSYAQHVAQRLRAAPDWFVMVPVEPLEAIRDSSSDPNARGFAAGALAARPQGMNNG